MSRPHWPRIALLLWPLVAALAAPAHADTPYEATIAIAGLKDDALLATLEATSQLEALKDKPPASLAALRRRAEDDLPRLQSVVQAQGYWLGQIAYVLDTNATPARIAVTATPGPLFHLATIAFVLPSGEPAALMQRQGPASVGLSPGAPALSAAVEAANARIVQTYAQNGQPFAAVGDRHAVVDLATTTMSVTYTIAPGVPARFGATAISGLKRVKRRFVERHIAWHEGAAYDERAVVTTRQELERSGLFGAVEIGHADAPDAAGRVAMTIALTEAPPRSVGVGAGYNTNIGLGGRAFWEHRDLFGEGEDLKLSAGAAQRQLGLAANFRRPDFLMPKQDLVASAELLHQQTDAYTSRREQAFLGVEEKMWPPYTIGTGLSIERAVLSETSRDENYLLLGAPSYVRRDTTDDLLDPTLGTRTTLSLTPYHSLLARDELNFVSGRLEGRAYQRLGSGDRLVLAGYAAVGSVVGASLEGLPADKRLYAGGAGSVRGYAYQLAGPLDSSDIPIGGRSSLELGTELRYRITSTIGIVPFLDAGDVYPGNLPNQLRLFYSAGIGLRYYTPFGPIRLDLAVPIMRRPVDRPVQLYISLGQAF